MYGNSVKIIFNKNAPVIRGIFIIRSCISYFSIVTGFITLLPPDCITQ